MNNLNILSEFSHRALTHLHRKAKQLRLAAILIFIPSVLLADEALPWQFIVQWDNDLLTGTDEGYTNGARIAFARELAPDSEQHYFLQDMLRKLTGAEGGDALSKLRFPDTGDVRFQYGVGLTQLMFTPKDPRPHTPPRGERPYAGWSGLEFSLQASAGDSASTTTLSLGTTGRYSYAKDMQDWVHENLSDSPLFQGWDAQAPSELTVNLHFDHKQRLNFLDTTRRWPLELDGFYEWGAALGNFRSDAYLGTRFRIGHDLPTHYATPQVQLGSFTDTLFDDGHHKNTNWSFYGYGGARVYAVLHDITLDGPLFRDWDASVDSKPWVGELSFGLATRYRQIELSLSHTLRSQEFDGQKNRSRYGSILLRIDSRF